MEVSNEEEYNIPAILLSAKRRQLRRISYTQNYTPGTLNVCTCVLLISLPLLFDLFSSLASLFWRRNTALTLSSVSPLFFRSLSPSSTNITPYLAALTSDRQYANQTNGFKIFDISHRDFQCAVITRQGTPCKNRVTCSFHNSTDKSLIPRSDSLEHLMRNYKYLQELHQTAYEGTRLKKRPLEQDSTIMRNEQMKRHNSYSNQGSGVQPRVTESVVETFITALHGKLQQVKEDEDERLCEFHYKLELKNFAIVEYYKGQLL